MRYAFDSKSLPMCKVNNHWGEHSRDYIMYSNSLCCEEHIAANLYNHIMLRIIIISVQFRAAQCAQGRHNLKMVFFSCHMIIILSYWKLSEFFHERRIMGLSFLLFEIFNIKVNYFSKTIGSKIEVKLGSEMKSINNSSIQTFKHI